MEDEFDFEFEFEEAINPFSLNGYQEEDEGEEIVKQCTFSTVIGDVLTDVVYKVYTDRYFVVGTQPGGHTGAGTIFIEQAPPEDCPDGGEFSFCIIRDCEGYRDAAKIIALGLAVDKPLYLCLCLNDYGSETINHFLEVLKSHL